MNKRFRGFLPVVIDVETAGLNDTTDALLEIAVATLAMDDKGQLVIDEQFSYHVEPFDGANIEQEALDITKIIPEHPFRFAISEHQALSNVFSRVRQSLKQHKCHRAILVGHNASFDLGFVRAAAKRAQLKRSPFHSFTTFDTACLSAVALGETVLARATKKAGILFEQDKAHSAVYDTLKTAELFCYIVNHSSYLG